MTTTLTRSPASPDHAALPPAVPVPPVPWRGRDAVAVTGMGVLGLVITIVVGLLVGWDFQEFASPQAALILLLNGSVPALLAYAYLWLRFRPDHRYVWRPGGTTGIGLGRALAIGGLVGVAWWLAVDVLAFMAVTEITGYEPPPVQQDLADALATPGIMQIAAWLAIVVIAPLGEELVFRGVLFLGVARWLGPIPAAVVSSIAFGLIHLQPELAATAFMTAYAAPFGLFACWLLHRFGSLWLPIGVHAGSNLASISAATVLEQM